MIDVAEFRGARRDPQVETMAYVGEEPWHGLGNKVEAGVTDEQMVKAAGLDWNVRLVPLFTKLEAKYNELTGRIGMVRDDTGALLDIVGSRYQPAQNHEILRFFREYVAVGDMTLETAGSLTGGQRIWALARLSKEFKLKGGDLMRTFLLLMNPHQYGKGMIIKLVEERVVCRNTVTIALAEAGKQVKLWHNRPFDEAVQQSAKVRLGIALERHEQFQEQAEMLAAKEIDEKQAVKAAAVAFGEDEELHEKPTADHSRAVRRVIDLWNGEGIGSQLESAKGTAWGLLNGVTQFVDHEYGRTQQRRLEHAWFGNGQVVKNRALDALLAV